MPGQIINGTVNVDQTEPYAAKKLVVSFIGSEHTFFDESNDKTRVHYRNDEIVQKQDFDLLDLAPYQNQCQIGKFTFPFSFQVPLDCKAPSFFSSERWYGKIALYQYEVRAQFVPVDENNTIKVNKNHYCSNYTGCREIIIRCPSPVIDPSLMEPQTYNHQKELKSGLGLFGGATTAKFGVELPKKVFAMGE